MKLNMSHVWTIPCAALLVLGAVAQSGQDPQPAPGAKARAGQTSGQGAGRTSEASNARSAALPLAIPIEGATETNASAIESALQSMTRPVWRCEGCEAVSPTKATCKACSQEMTEDRDAKVVRSAEVDAASGELRIALAPAQTLRVSELESKLQANGVKLDKDGLALPSFAKLQIATPAGATDGGASVEQALKEAKVVANVTVKEDPDSGRLVALLETRGGAKYADVATAVEKAGAGYQLVDVVFAAPCPACSKAGNVQANCKGCWHDEAKS